MMQKPQVLHHARNGGNLGIAVMQKSDALPIADVRAWWKADVSPQRVAVTPHLGGAGGGGGGGIGTTQGFDRSNSRAGSSR